MKALTIIIIVVLSLNLFSCNSDTTPTATINSNLVTCDTCIVAMTDNKLRDVHIYCDRYSGPKVAAKYRTINTYIGLGLFIVHSTKLEVLEQIARDENVYQIELEGDIIYYREIVADSTNNMYYEYSN